MRILWRLQLHWHLCGARGMGHVCTMPCAAYFVQCSCDSFDRQARLTENCLKSFSALDVEMESENRQGLIQITVCLLGARTRARADRQAGALDSNRRCRTGLCCIMVALPPHLPTPPCCPFPCPLFTFRVHLTNAFFISLNAVK